MFCSDFFKTGGKFILIRYSPIVMKQLSLHLFSV